MISQTKFEVEVKLLAVEHELRHARGNACAFKLMAETSTTEGQLADNMGCVAYWDRIADHKSAEAAALRNIINHHDND